MKKLAIVGKPNVGKSSLFNRFIKTRDAITSDLAGTTRDVKKTLFMIEDRECELLDTGGLDEGNELFDAIKAKSIKAAREADIILYMVDGRTLADDEDKAFFYELEKMGKAMALVVNKLDNNRLEEGVWEYYSFGADNIFPISVSHNRNVTKLEKWIYEQLPVNENKPMPVINDEDDEFDPFFDYEAVDKINEEAFEVNEMINVAIIGRVNVGKSSLLNALLNEDRSVVSSVAGTTIDPIDETITYQDKDITFIDTAGVRKRGKIVGIEKYALMRTQELLKRANLALLVLDASEPFKDLDEKIAGLIDENRLACLIVLNKWDMPYDEFKKVEQDLRDRFKFLHYAPFITLSALTKQRVHKVYDMILDVFANYSQRIKTSELNEAINKAIERHNLPSPNGKTLRIYYATQYASQPPQIALVMNRPGLLHFSYRRYLANKLREKFNFRGTPILFKAKGRGSSDEDEN
jgi:GTP-binding protein